MRHTDNLSYKDFEDTAFSTENLVEMLEVILFKKGIAPSENPPKDSTTNGR